MNDYKFGNFLLQLRTEKGLSQSQLGDMMGVSNKAVSKWEMGASKPRPAMLVVLASFFGVTVEELLAGERNASAEQRKSEKGDDTALKLWTGEYRKKKRRGACAIIIACLLPILLFAFAGVMVERNLTESAYGPIVSVVLILAEAIDVALIFVFYASARRLKRTLYAAYPEQAEEITAIISPKRERVPMLKWEKICVVIGALIAFGAFSFRIVFRIVARESERLRTVDFVALLLACAALLLELVAYFHYYWRSRRKK